MIYFNMTDEQKKLILRLILCTIISTLFSWVIHDEYCVTTAVTANLFLYIDRGYCGGNRYAIRRIMVQVIQGFILCLVIIPCKYLLELPIPDPILIMVACIVALIVGLPINFKYQYSPLNCTLANATFILAAYLIRDFMDYPYRVLHCIAGFVIGYVVNYIILPDKDRYEEVLRLLRECSSNLKEGQVTDEYLKIKGLLETKMKYLSEDSKKGLKRHRHTEKELKEIECFYRAIVAVENYIIIRNQYEKNVSIQFLQMADEKIQSKDVGLYEQENIYVPQTTEEILIYSSVLEYRLAFNEWMHYSSVFGI